MFHSQLPYPIPHFCAPLPNSHVTIGMRVRIIDFDRAEIVNVGEAKVGVEREEEVLERLLRRGAGPAT